MTAPRERQDTPQRWPAEYAIRHLTETFDQACITHPDLMEPYVTRLGDAETDEEKIEIKRAGLRETIEQRYPAHASMRGKS